MSAKDLAALCEVDLATARRWRRGAICPPAAVLKLLELQQIRGNVGRLHPAWAGWTINDRGELCSPENWICTPGGVRAIQFYEAQLATYRKDVRDLKAALESKYANGFAEDQPLPDQWEFKTA